MPEWWRRKIGEANLGKVYSQESREKIRTSGASKTFFVEGHTPWNKGKTHSEETKEKLSLARRKQFDPRLGTHHSPESKLKMRFAKLGKKTGPHSDERRQKIREARLRQVLPFKDTSIELLMQEAFAKRGIGFLTHVPLERVTQANIILLDRKVAIFCDGCYWHECSICALGKSPRPDVRQKDSWKTETLVKAGWTVHRFWEHEIRANVSGCVDKLLAEKVTKPA